MILPQPRSAIFDETCLVMLKRLLRLVEITAFHCASSIRANILSRVMPALLTRMSIGPTLASASAVRATQES